jgi:DNA helicase-2/ATP-dependent DNA helicase PcrA
VALLGPTCATRSMRRCTRPAPDRVRRARSTRRPEALPARRTTRCWAPTGSAPEGAAKRRGLQPPKGVILAGAGSGKTRVLTTRIAWLLQTGQVSPGGMMAVTFTNKAAKEMMTRLTAMLPVNVRGMWIGTFHGLCNRFLRAHYKLANLPQASRSSTRRTSSRPSSADEADQHRRRALPAQAVQWFIAGARKTACAPRGRGARRGDAQAGRDLPAYEDQCQREGVVDFGELMLRTYELLRDNARCASITSGAFATSWSTSSRTPTSCSTPGSRCSRGQGEAAADHAPSARVGRGRRRPEHLCLSRRAGRQHGRLRARVRVQHQIKLEQNYRSFSNILDAPTS